MKTKFKKIMAIFASTVMVGSSIGMAFAAGGAFPVPFVKDSSPDYAVVYGSGAAASDVAGANSLNDYLKTFYSTETSTTTSTGTTISTTTTSDFSSSSGVTEDEIALGSKITSEFSSTLKDNKVSTLLDTKISWDDGDGSDNYDIHEEIVLGEGLVIKTTLDDKELNSLVVLENNQALEYRYVFEDKLNVSLIGTEDADDLYLTILGKEYEILDLDDNSMTVSLSDERIVSIGSTLIVDEVTLTIGDIFEGSIEVNGNLIKEGRTKTINGIEVYVDQIAYHSSSTSPSKAIVKVGRDIDQIFYDGEEYIDGDETWEWIIANPGTVNGYIGVTYNLRSVGYDEDDDEENAIEIGESYILPENYGAVTFEGLTDVEYEDFEVYFDDKKVYQGENSSTPDVAIIEGETDESITLTYGEITVETNTLYLKYEDGDVKMYFKDINGDVDTDHEGRSQYVRTYGNASSYDIAKLVIDDKELNVGLTLGKEVILSIGEDITINLGVSEGIFDRLSDDKDAESEDVKVGEVGIGTNDDDVMDHYGIIIQDPESNADNDEVILSIPSEQVYAQVSVKGQGTQITNTETVETNTTEVDDTIYIPASLGVVLVKDSEIASVSNKNLILVGGSCINAETAKLLGGKACGGDFTLQTGVVAGKYLIQTFTSGYNADKVAVVVAGYNAADTTRAVNAIVGSTINIDAGQKHIA